MTKKKNFKPHRLRELCAVSAMAISLTLSASAFGAEQAGTLELSIIDDGTKKITPARVELVKGYGLVADDGLPIDGDCENRELPLDVSLETAVALMDKTVVNPYTKTVQFYSVGNSKFSSLPSGDYKLTVRKGPEYLVQKRDVRIEPGRSTKLTVAMPRWINMPKKGWYSADDHLHIARPVQELNPLLSKWMQAEDIHVANFLQYGNSKVFHNTLQYAHGSAGRYQEGDYILSAGQENPRTHFRGHTIILGESAPINFPAAYVIYQLFWEEAKRQGALSGYAHFGEWFGAEYGLGMDLPLGLLSFIEVLQFDTANYRVWYDVLNTGFRMTPTAGTDYPCGDTNLPGRERFYTKVDGDFSFDSWLKSVREGRTFVTNGPILEFRVDGQDIGAEVVLKKPSSVTVEGSVRFDPDQDSVDTLDVIVNGELFRRFSRKGEATEINFRFPYKVTESSWIAVRASGSKQDEARVGSGTPSVAHSAATYLTLEGKPPISAHPRAKILARRWLALLDDLEARLADDQIQYQLEPQHDGPVSLEDLKKNRPALLEAIQSARKYFTDLQR